MESGPLNHVHIDLFGPYSQNLAKHAKQDKEPKVCVVAMVDYFTKVVELSPIKEKSALTVARVFYNAWVCRYGVPAKLTSDNGSEFRSDFTHMVQRLGIEHVHTSANHPNANGAVEWVNQTIKRMLTAHYNEHPTDLLDSLPNKLHSYMRSPHDSLGLLLFRCSWVFCPRCLFQLEKWSLIRLMRPRPPKYVVGL